MNEPSVNPFLRVANSNDLTDDEVQRLWVNFDGDDRRVSFFDPTSPMATIVLGGKGSGKTHLFRYFSFPVQGARYQGDDLWGQIKSDGYVGIYTRAGGLNGSRFYGKGISDEQWVEAFSYYLELWFGQTLLRTVDWILSKDTSVAQRVEKALPDMMDCFDKRIEGVKSYDDLSNQLRQFQRELDIQVNEAAFSNRLEPTFWCSRGSVTFGFPKALASAIPEFRNVTFCYYVDEYENFMEYQQRYVNTLLRERSAPVTFRIGARSYGLHTKSTYSGGDEEIREGSEFQYLQLDSKFRNDPEQYGRFARKLLQRRIDSSVGESFQAFDIDKLFGNLERESGEDRLLRRRSGSERTHIAKLRKHLSQVLTSNDVEEVISCISIQPRPLLEKAAILRLYQAAFRDMEGIVEAGRQIGQAVKDIEGKKMNVAKELRETLSHYGDDLDAQLWRDSKLGSRPTVRELEDLIRMSEGLPRALLTMVGYIVRWAVYRGELGPDFQRISGDAIRLGLVDSGKWFLSDVPEIGVDGESIRIAIGRLGELFRLNRFADKPTECSLIGFSVDFEALSRVAKRNIDDAEKRSFLVLHPSGEKDRSSEKTWAKYHLSRVLTPMFELPVATRGHARLSTPAANAIFDASRNDEFVRVREQWRRRMYWPFGKDSEARGQTDILAGET